MHPLESLVLPLGRALRHRRADERASLANAPELDGGDRIALSSSSFTEGAVIPAEHCGPLIGQDISPALAWEPVPAATAQLLLIIDDVDVPRAKPGIHTIALLSPRDGLAEGALTPADPGIRFLPTLLGRRRYVGPRPIPGHGPHRYGFHLYALDQVLDVDKASALLPAAAGHVLASGTLTGTRES
jgi:phosphatidylethanolamine-binding protein (PEBP) family uncharacterized protein